jgi:hypothetical protein
MTRRQHPFRFNTARSALLASLLFISGCNLGPIEDLPSISEQSGQNGTDFGASDPSELAGLSPAGDDGDQSKSRGNNNKLAGEAELGQGGAAGAPSR